MKRILTLILVLLLLALSLLCCAKKEEEDTNGQDYFNARVVELQDSHVLTECTDVCNSSLSIGTLVSVSCEVTAAAGFPGVAVGDSIRVVFTGYVMESEPPQVHPLAVYRMDEDGNVIIE